MRLHGMLSYKQLYHLSLTEPFHIGLSFSDLLLMLYDRWRYNMNNWTCPLSIIKMLTLNKSTWMREDAIHESFMDIAEARRNGAILDHNLIFGVVFCLNSDKSTKNKTNHGDLANRWSKWVEFSPSWFRKVAPICYEYLHPFGTWYFI